MRGEFDANKTEKDCLHDEWQELSFLKKRTYENIQAERNKEIRLAYLKKAKPKRLSFAIFCMKKINLDHSHKEWKDSMETRAVLLIFSLEFEISGLAVQNIQQNSKKW